MNEKSSRKLLIVEDVPSTRMLIKGVLGKEGYNILLAENGAEAVEIFEREHPDAVLMDVMMPVMDGFEACQRIRALDRDEGTPIIMLTGAEDIDAISRAFEVGATDFITKPISWPLLSQRIRYAIRGGQLVRQVRQNRLHEASAQRIAQIGFWSWHPATDHFEWSTELAELLNYPMDEITTLNDLVDHVQTDDRERVRRAFRGAAASDLRIDLEMRLVGNSGERILRMTGERGVEGRDLDRLYGAAQNITDSRKAEALVDYLALHDDLTGLGNRRLFSQSLRQALEQRRSEGHGGVLVGWIDLTRFHRHNDAMGEQNGDILLSQVAQRLRLLAIDGAVARVGGDEFAVLLQDAGTSDLRERFDHLMDALTQPFRVGEKEAFLGVSAGVAQYPEHSADAEQLLTLAQEAQRVGRGQGRRVVQYDELTTQKRSPTLDVEHALRRALENQEFHLVYQPQMDLRFGRIVGVEALLRWKHPERGLVSPVEFIPVLEESGMIDAVGAWVIDEACSQARHWELAGTPLRVGINLSPQQFLDPRLFDTIVGTAERRGVSPKRVELEITESLAMQDPTRAIELLTRLRGLGYKIAIDDFGIGYSSLEYLLRFPIDTIKVDRAFVRNITNSQADRAIVGAITVIARTLGINTIAEGIETMRQCDFVEALGIGEIQGYLIGKPMSPREIEHLIVSFRRPGREPEQ
ncbi:EAL domain-containing protein [Thauera sp. CAU 1555]|uniref:EAL domain-containing protein n=1 Tax=Thauera sedimentorum TaxID=2767595 RepID=A0ABR9B6E7_9RHOO|nr:EAL domain-containing protein [Thauera sedimentorum]MBC9070933.1 EAL domain-containing protein [Thauera sedimentorum]MBD8501852.1 EAL domain-containing protein [Thauera sedimentorum]